VGWVPISARDAGSTASARLPGHHAQVGIALGAVALVADGLIRTLIGLRSSV
jgi:hypothetical protein